jgi:asparagine synthase (glutamine-hydrolysing)
MCGITGGWWREAPTQLDQQMARTLLAMRLRGPNDNGFELHPLNKGVVALGHTRLSIIDLSAGGHQPMYSTDNRYGLVLNGEIYNYRELRLELESLGYTLHTDSDTEVLLTAWQCWGKNCLTRLVGMFAFVVFDKQAGTLTCARDPFGIKPFFYTSENGNFLFASEIPAIKALKSEKIALDWQRAYDYLVHADYDTGPRSFLDGINHLQPGHMFEVDINNGQLTEPVAWWQPKIVENISITFADAAEELRERFLNNIRLHLRSDVPLGAALSGGVDSSAVVCAMRYVEPDLPINTFSYIAQSSTMSEEVWVDHINQHVGAIPHKLVVTPDELVNDLNDMILAQGEPFGSTSIYAQYRIFKLAKESGITVTLDGQGADELMAGYSGYPGQRVKSMLDTCQFKDAVKFLKNWSSWPGRSFNEGVKRVIGEYADGSVYDFLRRLNGSTNKPLWLDINLLADKGVFTGFPRQKSPFDQRERRLVAELALSITRRGLPSLLRHGDRNSMRWSVESRVPFLTTDLANFLLSLPESYLISQQGETKSVFRAAMRGIVPDEILNRKDKVGFETPEKAWLISTSDQIRAWLSVDIAVPFLNQNKIIEEFDLIVAGKKPFSWQVWRWINFIRWYQVTFKFSL